MQSIFDLCQPSAGLLEGCIKYEQFAADVSKVVDNTTASKCADPVIFFNYTHPTRCLKTLLETICGCLSGSGRGFSSVMRLNTHQIGVKKHALTASCIRDLPCICGPSSESTLQKNGRWVVL